MIRRYSCRLEPRTNPRRLPVAGEKQPGVNPLPLAIQQKTHKPRKRPPARAIVRQSKKDRLNETVLCSVTQSSTGGKQRPHQTGLVGDRCPSSPSPWRPFPPAQSFDATVTKGSERFLLFSFFALDLLIRGHHVLGPIRRTDRHVLDRDTIARVEHIIVAPRPKLRPEVVDFHQGR